MEFLIIVPIVTAAGFGVGYYVGARGMAGVKIDLDNAQRELNEVLNRDTKKTNTETVTVVTPSGDTKPTATITRTTTPGK